jgi:hypothetical protein
VAVLLKATERLQVMVEIRCFRQQLLSVVVVAAFGIKVAH